MKKNITVLGAGGMLGYKVVEVLGRNPNFEVTGLTRQQFDVDNMFLPNMNREVRKTDRDAMDSLLLGCDYLINCIGVIKPNVRGNEMAALRANSYFPWYVAYKYMAESMVGAGETPKFINVTTDCVFSGKCGPYYEDFPHDCIDFYGKSKSTGEPTHGCMNIRTSIIGEEKNHAYSLMEWCKSQAGQTVNGYANHHWNGITTTEYAHVCERIIEGGLYREGTFHVYSTDVTKYEMLVKISQAFDLNLGVVMTYTAPDGIDRRLRTNHDLCAALNVPNFDEMLKEITTSK